MWRQWLRELLLGFAVVATGCSYTFDDTAPTVPLVGEPIPPTVYTKLNPDGVPINDVYAMHDAHADVYWAVLVTAPVATLPPPPIIGKLPALAFMVRLDDSGATDAVKADTILVGNQQLYLLDMPIMEGEPTKLRLRRPGDDGVGRQLDMPSGSGLIVPSAHDEAFVYIVSRDDTRSVQVIRSDGSFARELPLPADVEVAHLFDKFKLFFDPKGEQLFTQDSDGKLIAHSTHAEQDTELGIFDTDLIWGDSRRALISCGDRGLRRIPIDGGSPMVLDATPCQSDVLRAIPDEVMYKREDALYVVRELGGTPQKLRDPPVAQVLAVGPQRAVVYSTDPPLKYGAGIGDGYIGDDKIMDHGRRPTFSLDEQRLRWLENAARSDNSGELMSAPLPGTDATLLARNVRQFLEVTPNRTLCISNSSGRGTYNRLIVVDENQQQAHWVIDSARAFLRVPDSNELLVSVVNGQIGYDVRRVPIPL